MNNNDLNTLLNIKDQLENKELSEKVNNAKIINPTVEIESSLTNFLTSRLERLENDAQFSDLIRMHIRQRLPEFTVDQLMQLLDQVTKNNNRSVEGVLPLFQGDSMGKTAIEHMTGSTSETTAQQLYASADKDMLQAVSYLSSIMSKIGNINVQETEVIDNKPTN